MINLAKVATLWISYSMTMVIRIYLVRYLPGDIYVNVSSSLCAELIAVLLIKSLEKNMDKKNLIKMFFILQSIGTTILLLNISGQSEQ